MCQISPLAFLSIEESAKMSRNQNPYNYDKKTLDFLVYALYTGRKIYIMKIAYFIYAKNFYHFFASSFTNMFQFALWFDSMTCIIQPEVQMFR